jgi:hypothetical protein
VLAFCECFALDHVSSLPEPVHFHAHP